MAKLVRAVHLTDPKSGRRLVLAPGEEPAPHLAALVTNPAAWEGGKLPAEKDTGPDAADGDAKAPSGDADQSAKDTKPAAAKKTAARKPAAKPAAD